MVEITAPVSLVRVARVHGPHGVRGEVRAESLGGDIRRFAPGVRLQTEAGRHVLTIESARDIGSGQILLRFRELTDREQASRLGGTYLCTDEEHLRPLGPNEWFVFRLVGLRARTASGAQLGEVVDVEEYPGHDVLVVRSPVGLRRFPMSQAFVERVDTDAGEIILSPWEEDESGEEAG